MVPMTNTTIPTRAGKLRSSSARRYLVVADFRSVDGKFRSCVERRSDDLGKAKNLCVASRDTFVFDTVEGKVVYVPSLRSDLVASLDASGLLAPGAVK
jgi:hypothetical protein